MDQIGESSAGRPELVCPGSADESTSGSITTRIRNSAHRLISSSFSRPSPSSAISSLASFSEERSKGGSLFASTNSSDIDSSSVLQSSQYSSIRVNQQHGPNWPTEMVTSQSWKNSASNKSAESTFEEFMSEQAPRPQLQQDLYTMSESQVNTSHHDLNRLWVSDSRTCSAVPPELASVWSRDIIRPALGICLDGAPVVAMLCDTEFSPDGDLEYLTRCVTEDSEEIHDGMPGVFPLANLHDLSTASTSSTVDPDSNVSNEKLSIAIGGTSREINLIEANRAYDLMPADGKLLSWLKNFKSYQDEVWGDMSYLPRKFREEKAPQGNGLEIVSKQGAAKRLAMVVRHINHTSNRK